MDEADVTELWKIREKEKKAAEPMPDIISLLKFSFARIIKELSL
jgi:hypothetical protein